VREYAEAVEPNFGFLFYSRQRSCKWSLIHKINWILLWIPRFSCTYYLGTFQVLKPRMTCPCFLDASVTITRYQLWWYLWWCDWHVAVLDSKDMTWNPMLVFSVTLLELKSVYRRNQEEFRVQSWSRPSFKKSFLKWKWKKKRCESMMMAIKERDETGLLSRGGIKSCHFS
jgi:hypothetical protein